jgi:hypothetical protein
VSLVGKSVSGGPSFLKGDLTMKTITGSTLKRDLLGKTAARKSALKEGAVAQALTADAVNQLTAKVQLEYRAIAEVLSNVMHR